MDRAKIDKSVSAKLEMHRDERAVRRLTRSPQQQMWLSVFSFLLGAVLFFGPLLVEIEHARTPMALFGLFFICVGQIYLWAYRNSLAIRALHRRLERLESKNPPEGTEDGSEG